MVNNLFSTMLLVANKPSGPGQAIGDLLGGAGGADAGNAIATIFYTIVGGMGIFFAIKALMELLAYFKAEDEREKRDHKERAIRLAIGIVICLLAGPIVNFLLKVGGLDSSLQL